MLSEKQMLAAKLFVYKDINKMKVEDIAKEVDVAISTLYEWKQNREFIKFQTILAEERMDEFLETAYSEIRHMATGKNAKEGTKLKALELVLRNRGKLKDRQDVNVEITQRSNEELENEIDEMLNRTKLE